MATSRKSTGTMYPILICSSEAARARIYRLLESEPDLRESVAPYSMSMFGLYEKNILPISSGKMLKALLALRKDGTLRSCKLIWPRAGMLSGGDYSTPSTLIRRKSGTVSLLSVLEPEASPKYYLSKKMIAGILRRSAKRNREARVLLLNRDGSIPRLKPMSLTHWTLDNLCLPARRDDPKKTSSPKRSIRGGGGSHIESTTLIAQNQRREVRRRSPDRAGSLSATQSTTQFQALETGIGIRRFTPLESERIMGWPDEWTRWGINDKSEKVQISDTQRYKMCGNGVCPRVVREVRKHLIL